MRKQLIPALLACLVLLTACGGIPEMDAADIARGAAAYTDEGGGTTFSVSEYDLLLGADGGERVFRALGRMSESELAARGYTDGQIEALRDYDGGALADAAELRDASARLTGSVRCIAATDTEITAELRWSWSAQPALFGGAAVMACRWFAMNAGGQEIVLALRADSTDGAAAVTRGGAEEAIPLENTDPYGFTTAPFDAAEGGFAGSGCLRVTIGVPETATASVAEAHIRFALAAACGDGESCDVTPGERDAVDFGDQAAELVSCVLTVTPGPSGAPSLSYQLGRIEREYLSNSDDTPAIVGADFTVTAGELARLTAAQALIDADTAAETAAGMLVEKYSLYARACADGAEVPDDEIGAIIEENVREFAAADDPDYTDFLAGLGQTSEEYQRSRAGEVKITETIAAWRQTQYEAFADEHTDLNDDALAQAWNAHWAALTERIIADEHVEYPEGQP